MQLDITLRPSLAEEFTVIGESPVVDRKKTGMAETFNRDYLEDVPNARDPWVIIDQTTGVDSDRYNVAGSESGQQASFIARGGSDDNTIWNYDGVNVTDPQSLGGRAVAHELAEVELAPPAPLGRPRVAEVRVVCPDGDLAGRPRAARGVPRARRASRPCGGRAGSTTTSRELNIER